MFGKDSDPFLTLIRRHLHSLSWALKLGLPCGRQFGLANCSPRAPTSRRTKRARRGPEASQGQRIRGSANDSCVARGLGDSATYAVPHWNRLDTWAQLIFTFFGCVLFRPRDNCGFRPLQQLGGSLQKSDRPEQTF